MNNFFYNPDGSDPPVSIFTGPNGVGKSHLLNRIALDATRSNRQVIAIANTVYDRFTAKGGNFHLLANRYGRQYPHRLMKETLLMSHRDGDRRLSHIATAMDYLGYEPSVGIWVVDAKPNAYLDSSSGKAKQTKTSAETEEFSASLNRLLYLQKDQGPVWIDLSDRGVSRALYSDIIELLGSETNLKHNHMLSKVSILVRNREGGTTNLTKSSSGQISLISTMAYISAHIQPGCTLLIDEPENSLHPEWQRKYIANIVDIFYYYEPRIFVATHAPMIVAGAAETDIPYRVFDLGLAGRMRHSADAGSVEQILWSAFGTLTPKSHFLSSSLVATISEVSSGAISATEADERISSFQAASNDERQRKLLSAARQLVSQSVGHRAVIEDGDVDV